MSSTKELIAQIESYRLEAGISLQDFILSINPELESFSPPISAGEWSRIVGGRLELAKLNLDIIHDFVVTKKGLLTPVRVKPTKQVEIAALSSPDVLLAVQAPVFISHSSRDRHFVEQNIVSLLRDNAVPTWYSPEDIKTASQWERSIRDALSSCSWFLFVMTPESLKSEWVYAEVSWAIKHRIERFIPVLAKSCDWEDFHLRIRTIQYLDFRTDTASAGERLLRVFSGQ